MLSAREWESGGTHTLSMLLDGAWMSSDNILIVLHGGADETVVTLPEAPGLQGYSLLWDSAWETPDGGAAEPDLSRDDRAVTMPAASMRIYRVIEPT